jgi:hypothetical protein
MQISRHWRLNRERYRLNGHRRPDGSLSLQSPFLCRGKESESGPMAEVDSQRRIKAITVYQALVLAIIKVENHAA